MCVLGCFCGLCLTMPIQGVLPVPIIAQSMNYVNARKPGDVISKQGATFSTSLSTYTLLIGGNFCIFA